VKRKSVLIGCGVLGTVLGFGFLGLCLIRHEPAHYRNAEVAAGPDRKKHSMEFLAACAQLADGIHANSQWYGKFTAEQINSYLSENFVAEGTAEKLLPSGVTGPRVTLNPGTIRLAFRYGESPFTTIVAIDLRVWLVPKEYNVIALEVESVHAGLMPINVQSMLERLADAIRQQNQDLEFSWYRHDGHPVALLRFQAGRVPQSRLQQLELREGEMTIYGCACDAVKGS
jgi:hypothetical protein